MGTCADTIPSVSIRYASALKPSSRAFAVRLSCRWPAVSMKRSGRPRLSQSMWILVSNHLGNAPVPEFWPPFSASGLLVDTNQSGVEHQVIVVAILDQFGK